MFQNFKINYVGAQNRSELGTVFENAKVSDIAEYFNRNPLINREQYERITGGNYNMDIMKKLKDEDRNKDISDLVNIMLKMRVAGVTSDKLDRFNSMPAEYKVNLIKNYDKFSRLY